MINIFQFWAHFCSAKTGLSAPMRPLRGHIPLLSLARVANCKIFLLILAFFTTPAFSQNDFLGLNARAAVLMDAGSGAFLYEKNPHEQIPPASLTKLMTIHIAQQLAEIQGVSLDEPVPLPPESWAVNQPPRSSLMFLAQGQIVSLRELFLGLAIPSGNDAAVAVALNFAPTVAQFAALMNNEASRLGLRQTFFVEPSGIDELNLTTAAEFARFCRAYIEMHPENLHLYHTVPTFAYPKADNVTGTQKRRPGTILQGNHISLLSEFPGADGLKTGYIDEAGYNLAATAERDGTRFIAVILGVPADLGPRRGDRARTEDAKKLLIWGYENFKTVRMDAPPLQEAVIWKGAHNRMQLAPAAGLVWTIPANRGENLALDVTYLPGLTAPLPAGSKAGSLTLTDSGGILAVTDLVTTAPVEQAGFLKRLLHSILMFFRRIKPAATQ